MSPPAGDPDGDQQEAVSDDRATVLVVDDEEEITDLYATWLEERYDVRRAYSGGSALEVLDDDVDVVLLDRRMPDLSGDEVLDRIRDQGLDSRVALVTAVDPDFDVLDLGFDEYLVKPVTQDDLVDVVERMLRRARYDETVQRYFSLASRKAALEAEKPTAELSENERYLELEAEIADLRTGLDDEFADLDDRDFRAAFASLDREN